MKKSKFQESTERFKKQTFQNYAKEWGEYPDSEKEKLFDGAVSEIEGKRSKDYAEKIMKQYDQKFLDKVFRWATDNLSQMELSKLGTFEKLAEKYILENQDKISTKEIEQFFDRKAGGLKKFAKAPSEEELYGIEADADGNIKETKRPQKKQPERPPIPSVERARKMTTEELEEMFEGQGVDITSLEGVMEGNQR